MEIGVHMRTLALRMGRNVPVLCNSGTGQVLGPTLLWDATTGTLLGEPAEMPVPVTGE
jgi:hypothetical protein